MKLSKIIFWASGIVFMFGTAFGIIFPEHSWATHSNPVGNHITASINTFGFITLVLLAFGITARQVERDGENQKDKNDGSIRGER